MKDEIETLIIEENPQEIEIIEIEDINIEIIDINEYQYNNKIEINTNEIIKLDNGKTLNKSIIEKIKEHLTNSKQIARIITATAIIIITLTGVFYVNNVKAKNTWLKSTNNEVTLEANFMTDLRMNGNDEITLEINQEYIEEGAIAYNKEEDITNKIVTTSNVDTSKIGTYHVIYSVNNQTQVRTINVVDTVKPTIKLKGSNVEYLLLNENYIEEGYIVTDNSNIDLTDKVIITNNVDTSRPGTYYINYEVKDDGNNLGTISRRIIVKSNYNNQLNNAVIENAFTETGINLKGYVNNNSFTGAISIKNLETADLIEINAKKTSKYYFNLDVDLTNYANGLYEIYANTDKQEIITNNMSNQHRIVRAHIGNKLVTMNYEKDSIKFKVEDFKYEYDVVIDPGHGGNDTGAANGKYVEKNINLKISEYEKSRYEAHGLKVHLLREENDTYGTVLGDKSMDILEQKAYAIGYYGVVSKIVYSNHHNSSTNNTSAGWEILVPASYKYENLIEENKIASLWSMYYIKPTNPFYRLYTKDYETATPYNKINGETYSFEDYYAVIRLPNRLFNQKNVIYEGAYVNNTSDINWYYTEENYKTLSEMKIKTYIESLGIEYKAP